MPCCLFLIPSVVIAQTASGLAITQGDMQPQIIAGRQENGCKRGCDRAAAFALSKSPPIRAASHFSHSACTQNAIASFRYLKQSSHLKMLFMHRDGWLLLFCAVFFLFFFFSYFTVITSFPRIQCSFQRNPLFSHT